MDAPSLTDSNVQLGHHSVGLANHPDVHSGFHAALSYGLSPRFSLSKTPSFSQTGTDGDDWLKGDRTQFTLFGLDGNDQILGATRQTNTLFGNNGSDRLQGGRKQDVLNGGSGRDQLTGNDGNDLLIGGSGNDRLWGEEGNDILKGESGIDRLYAGDGNDYLDGGAGLDQVDGGKGRDVLMDYDGGDRLTGGKGADQFGVGSPLSTQASLITDFQVGTDQIKILRLGATFTDLTFRQRKSGTEIFDQGKAIATLSGVKASSLSSSSFVFGNAQLATKLQANLAQFFKDNPDTTGMASTVVAPDGTFWQGFTGDTSRENQAPVNANSVFSVGSVTKPIIATTILQLQDEGRLSLDDTLSQWLPELSRHIANSDRITIRQLLNHSSGIPDYLSDPNFLDPLINNPALANESFTPQQLVSYIADQPALFEPGQGYSYCNTEYILLGEIIETVTGSTVASQLHQRIFDPLGMSQTVYAPQEPVNGTLAQGYIDQDGDGQLDLLKENLSWAGAAGGIVSTSADIAKFSQALVNGELLAPATLNAMINNNVATDAEGLRYGSGFSVTSNIPELGDLWGHNGATFVSQSQMYYLPQHQITTTITATSPLENITASLVLANLADAVQRYSTPHDTASHAMAV